MSLKMQQLNRAITDVQDVLQVAYVMYRLDHNLFNWTEGYTVFNW